MTPKLILIRELRRALGRGPFSRPRMLKRDKVVVVPFAGADVPPATRVGVVIHIYHAAMGARLRALCENIACRCDILVTTDTPAKAALLEESFAGWAKGDVTITVIPNRGRDMPSKFVTYRDRLQSYDLLLFLHSKRSEHIDAGNHDWGDVLLETMVGSPAIASANIVLLLRNPDLGVVFPDHYDRLRPLVNWGENRRRAGEIAARMGVDLDRAHHLEYPSGSMFWARPRALVPLLELGLSQEDFDPELGQIDGTLAHALERLILYSAERQGLGWLKVVTERHYANRGNRIAASDVGAAQVRLAGTDAP